MTMDRETFWEIYKTLPTDLQSALFSDDGEIAIEYIGEEYEIPDFDPDFISEKMGEVYLGLLSPLDFFDAIKPALKVDEETFKKIRIDLDRSLFRPVRASLDELYDVEY